MTTLNDLSQLKARMVRPPKEAEPKASASAAKMSAAKRLEAEAVDYFTRGGRLGGSLFAAKPSETHTPAPLADPRWIGRTFVHFKGGHYRLLGYATHSETRETMVIYQALYGEKGTWVRPAKMFFEAVEKDGYKGPRFRAIS